MRAWYQGDRLANVAKNESLVRLPINPDETMGMLYPIRFKDKNRTPAPRRPPARLEAGRPLAARRRAGGGRMDYALTSTAELVTLSVFAR
jgi:hypothetical protein